MAIYLYVTLRVADKNNNDNIGDSDNNNFQPEQEHLKIPNPKNPKQQIIFQYSKKKKHMVSNVK